MKGLIIKDFCNAKSFSKQYLIILAVMAVCSFGTKNLSFLTVYIVILGGMQCITTMNVDENCGFNKFALTTPLGIKKLVGAKYIFFLCSLGIAWLVSLLLHIVIGLLPKADWGEFSMKGVLGIICCLAACFSTALPLVYKYGVEKARYTYVIAMAIAFALINFAGHIAEEKEVASLLDKIPNGTWEIVATIISIGIVYLSYRCSVRAVEKKEW